MNCTTFDLSVPLNSSSGSFFEVYVTKPDPSLRVTGTMKGAGRVVAGPSLARTVLFMVEVSAALSLPALVNHALAVVWRLVSGTCTQERLGGRRSLRAAVTEGGQVQHRHTQAAMTTTLDQVSGCGQTRGRVSRQVRW